LEGPERLLDFGTAELSAKEEAAYLEKIDSLFDATFRMVSSSKTLTVPAQEESRG